MSIPNFRAELTTPAFSRKKLDCWYPYETSLNTNNVNTNTFGFAFCQVVDDKIQAQPLVVMEVNIQGVGVKNIVYVATLNNSPSAFLFDQTDKSGNYYKQVKEIQNTGDSLTKEQAFIADFWDDYPFKLNVSGHMMFGTKKFSPVGHRMSIAGIAAKKAGADFPTTVYASAKTAIALSEAFIQ